MANTSPDLSQTLQNLSGNFPGAVPGANALPPQAIDAQLQALFKGLLAPGDKAARISDILTEMSNPTTGVAAIIKASGLLDENDLKPITAIAPFILMPVSRVWTKGNICYVSVTVQIPALATGTVVVGLFNEICAGLPPNPANGANSEANATLLAMTRYNRATNQAARVVSDPASTVNSYKTGVAQVSADGILQLACATPLLGNATANYVEYLTISGHYPISLADAVV